MTYKEFLKSNLFVYGFKKYFSLYFSKPISAIAEIFGFVLFILAGRIIFNNIYVGFALAFTYFWGEITICDYIYHSVHLLNK